LGVNIIRQLDEVLERSYAVGCDILQGLFGQGGLRDCCDVVSVDAAADQLRQGVLTTAPSQFIEYFERRIVGLMRQNSLAGDRMNMWKNNCDSMNN
jgi:hypothetical protein